MKEIARMLLMLILAIFYMIFPYDFIPDYLGRVGRVDDILVLLLIIWIFCFKPLFDELRSSFKKPANAGPAPKAARGKNGDYMQRAFQILNMTPTEDAAEVKKAYYEIIKLYHPDRLDGLGPELRQLALEKTREINEAYEYLCRNLQ